MPCPSTIYCISNTGVPLYNNTYEDTFTNYNGVQYYTGQTNGLFIYYSSGDTQWCLSNTLGGTCYLSGKSPCSTTCPDLCDELFSSGVCPTPTPTPTNNCSSLDFAALFDCNLPPTPTATPTMTVTPTVTVTPTSSSLCPPPFILANIFSLSPTPTPTPTITPSPSVMVERDCTFSGAVTYDMINDDIVCPFSYEFQDCYDKGTKYYTFDTLENPSGGEITQFMVFNATVLVGGSGTPQNRCIHYVGFNNQISGVDRITLLDGPFGFSNLGGCLNCEVINTPTPTPTPTVTPTQIPLEGFIIQAVNITYFQAPDANDAMTITSLSPFSIIWDNNVSPKIIEYFPAGNNIPINHTYSSPYTGDIIIQAVDLSNIKELEIEARPYTSPQSLSVTTTEIGKLDGLLKFEALYQNALFVTGSVHLLPNSLITLSINNTNVTGTTAEIPSGLTTCDIRGTSIITGSVNDLPNATISLSIEGGNTIFGNVADLPNSTLNCVITGNNTLSGNTSDLPTPSGLLIIGGPNNTLTGNVANLSNAVQVEIYGQNTISGNISGFTNGNTSTVRLVITGQNTVTGSIADFTNLLTLSRIEITGDSSFSGNLSDLPIASPTPILTFVTLVPSAIPAIGNTFNGSTSTLPASLTSIQLASSGTFSGDLIDLPTGVQRFNLSMNTNLTYDLGISRVWATDFFSLDLPSTTGTLWNGFTTTETDKLLIDISGTFVTTSSITNRFNIRCGDTPKRTSASNAAFTLIDDKLQAVGNSINLYPI